MSLSRREALAAALSTLVAGPAPAAASRVLEVQGGQYLSFDGARLFYRRMGSGPPVVLLHQFLSDGPRNWFSTGVAQAVAQAGFSVVAPDARALGLSAAPPPPYPKDVLAMDVEALLRVLDIRSFSLFGYAMGARTAVRLMVRGARPERCILAGTGELGVVETEQLAAGNAETIRAGRDARDPKLGVLVRAAIRLQKLNPDALVAVLRSQVSTPPGELARIRTPILVLDAESDRTEGDPGMLAALFPNATALHTAGDHMSAPREPRFAAIATGFLKARGPAARFVPPAAP